MASSPRSMWTGMLRLNALNIAVTIGKSTEALREASLVTVCAEHGAKIDGSHRCGAGHADCSLERQRAVVDHEGNLHPLEPGEFEAIENATKSDLLEVVDVQPVDDLPMAFSMGTYYLRPDKKVKGSVEPFAVLHAALAKSGMGMIVKLCRSSSQRLAVVHASDGMILLTQIPFLDEIRKPGDQERAHWKIETPEAHVNLVVELLEQERGGNGFDWPAHTNDGYRLRSEAVERVLAGEQPDEQEQAPQEPQPNYMDALMASLKKEA